MPAIQVLWTLKVTTFLAWSLMIQETNSPHKFLPGHVGRLLTACRDTFSWSAPQSKNSDFITTDLARLALLAKCPFDKTVRARYIYGRNSRRVFHPLGRHLAHSVYSRLEMVNAFLGGASYSLLSVQTEPTAITISIGISLFHRQPEDITFQVSNLPWRYSAHWHQYLATLFNETTLRTHWKL
jgi:hypothetical protein